MIRRTIVALGIGCFTAAMLPFALAEHPKEHPSEHPSEHPAPKKKEVTTSDIADGIKKHIDDGTKMGGGKFKLKDGDKELSLALDKVHNDKLANLGGGSYFACVDFKGDDGNTYDVDFFLSGDAGAMKVTETIVHKVNGQPRYNWEQKADGTWTKVPLKK